MDITRPLPLLGGLTPEAFMAKHWQKKPLLVRGAVPQMQPVLERGALFDLAAQEDVESRLIVQEPKGWTLRRGPFGKRALPALSRERWTLLVQGVDLHVPAAHALLSQFRFVPDARLDDLMISYATHSGGVGPHFDSYDVFLLQAQGRRRWRYGRQKNLALQEGVPLKILAEFEPGHDVVLEPGDMLYLPPRYAHDGIAEGSDCQTYSIGFRAPREGELARELLQRLADDAEDALGDAIYKDAAQPPVVNPGAIPADMQAFARAAVEAALRERDAIERALGESLTEPKGNVWFEGGRVPRQLRSLRLDARTRMLYDARHIFVNGESWRAAGADARLMRRLADVRRLDARELSAASEDALALLRDWCEAGWAHGDTA